MAAAKTQPISESELKRGAAFRSELRRFLSRTEVVTKEAGLTSQRYDLLLMIAAAGELRVTELCDLLRLQQTAVTELVKRTEHAGLVKRRPSPDDGRVWVLEPTAEGERRLRQAFTALRDDRHALAGAFRDLQRSFRAASD
jgi:DNA-binding MarR family transcriptional regulator